MKTIFCIVIFLTLYQLAKSQHVHLITVNDLNNRIAYGKDTTYVINFWSTLCTPCIKQLPYFEKLNEQFKNKKLKVLLVSIDLKSQLTSAVIPFVKRKKIKSEILLFDEENQQEFIERIDAGWSGSIPATLFIKNKKREFFERDITYEELLDEYKYLQ